MKTALQEFNENYADALPCPGYALLRVSPRRWHILKLDKRRGIQDGMQVPDHWEIIDTCRNSFEATTGIRQRVIQDLKARLLKEGTAYLDTLTDGQVSQLPLGPILEADLRDYMTARIARMTGEKSK